MWNMGGGQSLHWQYFIENTPSSLFLLTLTRWVLYFWNKGQRQKAVHFIFLCQVVFFLMLRQCMVFFLFQVKSACSNYIYKTFFIALHLDIFRTYMQPHGSARITLPVPIHFKAVRIWITFSRLWWQGFFTHETINMILL